MSPLQIHSRRERALVAAADRVLALGAGMTRPFRRRRAPIAPRRILLLRLVGSCNADLAGAIDPIKRVQTLDAAWLARRDSGLGLVSLLRAARRWRALKYDLVINFEPDVRSNLLAAASGAAWAAGYRSGGGGALLDVALDYDTRAHTTDNARRLVAATLGSSSPVPGSRSSSETVLDHGYEVAPILIVPAKAHDNASRLLGAARGPLVGVHVSGGRAIKQWEPDRFADVARRLIEATGAAIVLTGSGDDRGLVDSVKQALPPPHVIDVAGHLDLLTLGAILERLDLFITGDTGPMHLAAAVGTPIVAVFGPSDPARYAPRGRLDRIIRVDLPCSPCNRIRLPPARCVGHTPDCLAFLSADSVFNAAIAVLREAGRRSAVGADTSTA